MNLTKFTQAAGVQYLLSTVATGDVPHASSSAMHSYYVATGTPPGRWLGRGAQEIGLAPGGAVTESAATSLYQRFEHPLTGQSLTGQGRVLHRAKDDEVSAKTVAGFDLTFTVPKSVSLVWAAADEDTQRAILTAHHAAITQTIEWIEDEVASTRSGRGGVVTSPVRGLVAARYDHWDSRNGDPHLHSHVAVANRVQRAHDGKWLTINSAALYRAAVAASELHENLLLDELHRSIGLSFHESTRPVRSKAVVMDVDGVPDRLIEHMSSRDTQVRVATVDLVAQWQRENPGRELDDRTMHVLTDRAWKATRQPKAKTHRSLGELVTRWRSQIRGAGVDPAEMVAASVNGVQPGSPTRSAATGPLRRELAASVLDTLNDETASLDPATAARAAVEKVMGGSATWTISQVRAEADRLTRHARAQTPGARRELRDAIVQAALDQCVELSPDRYHLTYPVTGHRVLDAGHGRITLNDHQAKAYTHTGVLDAEAQLVALATTAMATPITVDAATTTAVLDRLDSGAKHPLAADQRAAVEAVVASTAAITAVVGPAGTGKTTTVRAICSVWETQHGPGSMLALATSARAAAELAEATGIEATTVAKLLFENSPERIAGRAERRTRAVADIESPDRRRREYAKRMLADADLEDAAYRLRPGQLVVVDEASMTGTFDLAQIARLTEAARARMLLVGDPAQLDSPSAGGFLGWMERGGHAHHLTALFRFNDPVEAQATLRLRAGEASVILPAPPADDGPTDPVAGFYDQAGRIHDGADEDVLEGAYTAVRDALAQGRSAILIAATNAQVDDLNTRATLDRRAAGLIDTTRTAAMRTGMDAGIGDIILARKIDRRVRDTADDYVRNGDLFTITSIGPDGRVTARRPDGHHVTFDAAWLAQHAELGYATTAHRAQGITVDDAHVVMTSSERLTRELLYVALSRGRDANHVWVGLLDEHQAHDENLRVTERPTAHEVLTACLASEGAERTAHEVRDSERHRLGSLDRLLAERDYLAAVTAAPTLTEHLTEALGHERTAAITDSPAWEALVATWRHATNVDADRTDRLLRLPITTPDPDDPIAEDGGLDLEALMVDEAAILRSRLDRGILARQGVDARDPLAGLLAQIDTPDTALADIADQNYTLVTGRVTELHDQVTAEAVPGLPARPADGDPLQEHWDHAALLAATYADAWGQPHTADPGTNERQARHRAAVRHRIANWTTPAAAPSAPAVEVDHYAHPDRIWFDADLPLEAWTPDLEQALTNANADEPPLTDDEPAPPRALVPAAREFTDYERRLVAANEAAWTLWRGEAPQSWLPDYLHERGLSGTDAGYAPGGPQAWTRTFDVLRAQGFTTDELLDAGLVARTSRGSVVDRFRDRLVLPIRDPHDRLVAFTARVNPAETDPKAPKYLNTSATSIYTKAQVLYGLDSAAIDALRAGAVPVLVEGGMDAAAIAHLGGQYVPIAPCGTSLTPEQLTALDTLAPGALERLLVALDSDKAGTKATLRTWDLLPAGARGSARAATLPTGFDPADLIEKQRADDLHNALRDAPGLATAVAGQILAANRTDHPEGAINTLRHIAATVAPHLNDLNAVGHLAGQIAAGLDYDLDPSTIIDTVLDAHQGVAAPISGPQLDMEEATPTFTAIAPAPERPDVDYGPQIA